MSFGTSSFPGSTCSNPARIGWPSSAGSIVLFFTPFFFLFLFHYFTWKLFLIGFIYSMVVLGTHGTVYLHRYSTHHAFTFTNRLWLFVVSNLVLKIVPEEVYVVSHHVHHYIPEKPGDPYNVHGGFLYCFLADANHQAIARDFYREDYAKAARLIEHTVVPLNSYEQYQKWGRSATRSPPSFNSSSTGPSGSGLFI